MGGTSPSADPENDCATDVPRKCEGRQISKSVIIGLSWPNLYMNIVALSDFFVWIYSREHVYSP